MPLAGDGFEALPFRHMPGAARTERLRPGLADYLKKFVIIGGLYDLRRIPGVWLANKFQSGFRFGTGGLSF
jgi:hypothetical protein